MPDTMQPEATYSKKIAGLARSICELDPGSAAALRRGPQAGAGAAAFWMLLNQHVPDRRLTQPEIDDWATLMQAIAILTPKGDALRKTSAHASAVPMGMALFTAGLSDLRLARLLGAPRHLRRELILRTCRNLANQDQRRFDLRTLDRFIRSNDQKAIHRIAREYYHAEAEARRQTSTKEKSSNG